MVEQNSFKWRHFQVDLILLCVRWYLRYALSYRDLKKMMIDRGLHVDHTTIYRGVQQYVPELEKLCPTHLKTRNDLWRVDATSINTKKVWTYLYRAVDSQGNMRRFFCKALHASTCSAPQNHLIEEPVFQPLIPTDLIANPSAFWVINVDKNAAYSKATRILPESVELSQVKYFNNLIEQVYRFIKRLVKPGQAFFLSRWLGEHCKDMKA